ncbi:hypothetical protein KUF71_015376 [Frankliniella fusca]|uniref:Uncharacterized protein n=1 Tax=Frankliniella fusca TaxID=407009 RepID=A0AAE1HTB2_9NEOP|nr:hypothetical protein KUF71_015376 [Frankliniella fusca]
MNYIRIIVFSSENTCETLYVSFDHVAIKALIENKSHCEMWDGDFDSAGFEIVTHHDLIALPDGDQKSNQKKLKFRLVQNVLAFSYFIYILRHSNSYRQRVVSYWFKKAENLVPRTKNVSLKITLNYSAQQIIDHMWCERISHLVMERAELDNAMSWLSTLGGAYSALGDHFSHCADMAGRISLQQFQLALRLGDPSTVARCKLYIALSLIQKNKFKLARKIIETQYHLCLNSTSPDIRLLRMCKGIWSKLRYERYLYMKAGKKSHLSVNV